MRARRWFIAIAVLGFAVFLVARYRGVDVACAACKVALTPAALPASGHTAAPSPTPTSLAIPPTDPLALSRLFRLRMTCERMAFISRELERQGKDPDSWINNADTAKALDPEILKGWQNSLSEWQANREACAKLGTSVGDGSIYDIALRAANAGDGDAATCYISTRWPTPTDPQFKGQAIGHSQMGVLPSFISDYNKNARRLLDEGMKRGDWRMVTLTSEAFNDRHGQLIGSLRSFDPPDGEYVNFKLMLLGSRGETAARVSAQIELASQQVPAGRVAAANARAQQMYDRYFADKGEYEWGYGGCR